MNWMKSFHQSNLAFYISCDILIGFITEELGRLLCSLTLLCFFLSLVEM